MKRIYSGIQPTGCITIGNYIGAIKNWLDLQYSNDCIFAIANQHALTVKQEPSEFRERSLSFFAQYLACGLDAEKSILYIQSNVAAHSELTWILSCFTYIGELYRMTQFKDKSTKNEDNINAGLLTYPVLMAADILLYNTDLVPVGKDQKQHLELTRDIAMRFNHRFGEVFTVPEPFIPEQGAKITSLQNPLEKMSKSDPDANAMVSIIDAPEVIMRKFKRAITDSDNRIYVSEDKPGITNLLTIYSTFTGESIADATNRFEGKGYGEFKIAVGEAVVEALRPVQERYKQYMSDKAALLAISKQGAERAERIAARVLAKVKKKVGFVTD